MITEKYKCHNQIGLSGQTNWPNITVVGVKLHDWLKAEGLVSS